ncbi:hypothetical protein Pcinc_033704 [Petrolisthes cinctipes]|uniref:Mutator-like transposase domain-containing protein n=1 Tax=Petrolisthes cinctipes TaxID=88211 RepID=A0AAE1ERR3_PETCI|nr:hypothetical protein Pcinc_033704 [Petrolisthes cinctipes]
MKQYQERVVAGIYKYYAEELHIYPDDNGILDIEVSYDGSWMTSGHKSKIGAAFVIDCFTGSVVDYLVLSSYCGTCTVLSRKKISSDERKKLKEKHQSKCKVNYTGSSGGMEKEAAVTLWKSSSETLEVQKVFEGKRSTPRPAKKRKRSTTKEEHYKSGDF